jgi:hypothetical protein
MLGSKQESPPEAFCLARVEPSTDCSVYYEASLSYTARSASVRRLGNHNFATVCVCGGGGGAYNLWASVIAARIWGCPVSRYTMCWA